METSLKFDMELAKHHDPLPSLTTLNNLSLFQQLNPLSLTQLTPLSSTVDPSFHPSNSNYNSTSKTSSSSNSDSNSNQNTISSSEPSTLNAPSTSNSHPNSPNSNSLEMTQNLDPSLNQNSDYHSNTQLKTINL